MPRLHSCVQRVQSAQRLPRVAGVLAALGLTAVALAPLPAASQQAPRGLFAAGTLQALELPRLPVERVRAPREREADAQRMLAVIRESLERGDRATAETQFEILQGRHPDSDAYAAAQGLMRSAAAPPAAAPPPPPMPPAVAARTVPTEPAPVERGAPGQASRPWSTEIRRVKALTQDFQASTGDRIFFGEGSADLGSRARVVLSAQAEWLKRFPQVPVVISAHADDRGSREFNEDLSIRRGEAVKARLMAEGVPEVRIRVIPHGREVRLAPCDSTACAAQNRRVVTIIGDAEPPSIGTVSAPARR